MEDYRDPQQLTSTPLIKHLLRKAPLTFQRRPRRQTDITRGPPPIKSIIGNPDLAVLKPENQTPTHVTPSIALLAQGLVTEQLIVLGPPPPPPPKKGALAAQEEAAHKRLCHLITAAKVRRKSVNVKRSDRYGPQSRYLKAIEINHETYRVRVLTIQAGWFCLLNPLTCRLVTSLLSQLVKTRRYLPPFYQTYPT